LLSVAGRLQFYFIEIHIEIPEIPIGVRVLPILAMGIIDTEFDPAFKEREFIFYLFK